jgi:hypothetical protein
VHWNRQAPEESDLIGWEEAIAQNTKRDKELRSLLGKQAIVTHASEAVQRADIEVMNHYNASPNQGAATDAGIIALQNMLADLTESADALTAEARRARAWDAYIKADEANLEATIRAHRIGEHVTELSEHLDAARGAIATAEACQAAQAQAEARQATRRQAEERLAGLEADEAAFKAARLAWQEGVGKIMDEALREVLKVCEVFTTGLFTAPLTVHALELGRYENQSWVPLDAFSGSDARIACAAVQAALAVRHTGFRLVIIDEFGVVDPARKPVVLANLAAAVEAGLVDQVMIFDNRDIDGVPEGINEIHLEQQS